MGTILVPEKKILRIDGENKPYEVFFTKPTVKRLSEMYLEKKYTDAATLEHAETISGVNLVERWIVENKLKDKIVNLIEIIKGNKKGKFLVFSAYDETFNDIIKEFDKANITHSTILGAVTHINNVINDFTSGKINVVMMNAKHYGSGLNLQMATDIILYHEMPKELETQVIGRAQRLGRTDSLVVHYLLHENEKCNSSKNLSYTNEDYETPFEEPIAQGDRFIV
jgi:SNF2 family DNA or RNA helicase